MVNEDEAEQPAPQDLGTHRLEERLRAGGRMCDVLGLEGDLIRAREQTQRRIQDEIYARREELLASPASYPAVLRAVVLKHLHNQDGFIRQQIREAIPDNE